MTKQITSFSFEKDTICILEKISTAFGKNRSEFLETLIVSFYTPENAAKIEQILKLQSKVTSSDIIGEAKKQ